MTSENSNTRAPIGSMVAGRYRVGALIGSGGASVVHEVEDIKTGQAFALKVLDRPSGAAAAQLHDAQIALKMASPHAVKVVEVGALGDGRPFVVMERLEGSDLDKRLRERGPTPVSVACDLVLQACHALAEAHRLGVVHRSLKLSNLFLVPRHDGSAHVKLLDLGLAPLFATEVEGLKTMTGSTARRVTGAAGYAAPEQIGSSRSIDERADVWALGVILFELVTGRLPFDARSLLDSLVAAGSLPVPEMGAVPPELNALVRRCLQKDRELRFPDVVALAVALGPLAPPEMVDYPELVRQASVAQAPAAEGTLRMLPGEGGPPSSAAPTMVNLTQVATASFQAASAGRELAGPASTLDIPPSSLGVPPSSASGPASAPLGAPSTVVGNILLPQVGTWAAYLAVAGVAVLALWGIVARASGTPSLVKSGVQAPPAPSASMLLPPLARTPASPDAGVEAVDPAQDVP
jgi:serine/threonine-protein kinase